MEHIQINKTLDAILQKSNNILEYIDSKNFEPSTPFKDIEVQQILKKEENQTKINYNQALSQFIKENNYPIPSGTKRFVVYWGYPGAGKSFMQQKIIDRFKKEENCLPFYIIDKDKYRNLFPNLFEYLKDGHLEEYEKFAGIATDYVRQILDLSIKQSKKSIISIGSMGAAGEFNDNALKAIKYNYKPCAVYMSVNPSIAYLSGVYRSYSLYENIILRNEESYPRPILEEYMQGISHILPSTIGKIDKFQKENNSDVDLMVVNRNNMLLYDSRQPTMDVQEVIKQEENRIFNAYEVISIDNQLEFIEKSIKYRYENKIYTPHKDEANMTFRAVKRISDIITEQKEAINDQYIINKNNNLLLFSRLKNFKNK